MASVRGNSESSYDLGRVLRMYDDDGPLADRAAELWRTIAPAEMDLAREFWRRYRRSDEVKDTITDEKVEELATRILPYLRDKFTAIASPQWVATARSYVEQALAAHERLCLHASMLTLTHPQTGERLRFECPAPF